MTFSSSTTFGPYCSKRFFASAEVKPFKFRFGALRLFEITVESFSVHKWLDPAAETGAKWGEFGGAEQIRTAEWGFCRPFP